MNVGEFSQRELSRNRSKRADSVFSHVFSLLSVLPWISLAFPHLSPIFPPGRDPTEEEYSFMMKLSDKDRQRPLGISWRRSRIHVLMLIPC